MKWISWLTLFGMSSAGVLLIRYGQDKKPVIILTAGKAFYLQALAGIFFGSLSALLGILLIRGKMFVSIRQYFITLLVQIKPGFFSILFYSLSAAIGEETLFRAGIQPLIGLWPAAIVFVLLHGYVNPYNLQLSIYGFFLIVISAGFGYLFRFFGLFSCIMAHFVYDVALFCILTYGYKPRNNAPV